MMEREEWPRVAIIVLNWNGWRDTIECLESLYQITYPNYDVIVVDNGSKDESIQKIREYCEGKIRVESKFFEYNSDNKPIRIVEYTRIEAERMVEIHADFGDVPSNKKLVLIRNEMNYGFAEGNNIGMKYSLRSVDPCYVLLLNNDTVVDKNFLNYLVKVAEDDITVGVVGPKILYYTYPNVIFSLGAKINLYTGTSKLLGCEELDTRELCKVIDVDYVSGCAILFRRSLIERIKFLNSQYFAYFEETEACIRAKKIGFKILCVPSSKIWHKISQSSRKSGLHIYYLNRNRFIFIKNNSQNLNKIVFLLYFIIFKIPIDTFVLFLNNHQSLIKQYYKGVFDGIKLFFGLNLDQ